MNTDVIDGDFNPVATATQPVALVPTGNSNAVFVAPAATVEQAVERYAQMKQFIQSVLRDKIDYDLIPGTQKKTLMKPGAEKLATFFGLMPRLVLVDKIEDWDKNLFFYRYRCDLYRGEWLVASSEGTCSSYETKYRYRWLAEHDLPAGIDKSTLKTRGGKISEFEFAIDKAETSGAYAKPAEYWARFKTAIDDGTAKKIQKKTKSGMRDAWEIDGTLYAITNQDMADVMNTVLKMAQKRAYVGTVIFATNASEFFTQDLESFEYETIGRVETLEEGRERLMLECIDWYPTKADFVAEYKRLGLPRYSLEQHNYLRKELIESAVLMARGIDVVQEKKA